MREAITNWNWLNNCDRFTEVTKDCQREIQRVDRVVANDLCSLSGISV